MPANDFKQLSSRDFEELTRDLLQAEWGVALEAFKTGRDQGIDLRRITAEQGTLIVQCKHFATSGYAKLLAHLQSTELEKVRRLNPERYVLVTSVALSPHNKDAIQELLAPFILSPNDVIGANDIDGLLQRHPDVARANFKLWLTSTEILERVLHNAVRCQTEFEIERVIRKLPIFVQNAAYPRAQEILNATNVLVISGVPGIGKTTLAEIILYAHLEQGYEPIVIQTDVREGKDVFKPKRRQVFYFDDFLGQTFLGEGRFPGSLNSDVALVEFVEMVRATGQSRFILTTREHLLQGARTASERLSHSALMDARCVLELADYSKGQRARILYNHLYFSDLAREYKEEMLRDEFFLEVIGHKHFSPRLIEWLSAARRLRNVQSADYQSHVRNILANPHAIWSYAFNNQISAGARNVLLTLLFARPLYELIELEPAWKALNSLTAQKYNRPAGPKDYSNALKELDNAFVAYRGGRVDFLNPSVREMVAAEICTTPEFVLDVVTSASRFQQITSLLELAEQGNATIQRVLSENGAILEASMVRLLRTPAWRWDRQPDGRSTGTHIDIEFEQRLVHIGGTASFLSLPSLRRMFETEVRALPAKYATTGGCSMRNARSLIEGFDRYPQLKAGNGIALQRELLDTILDRVDISYADQINVLIDCSEKVAIWSAADGVKLEELIAEYRSQGCDEEFDNCQDSIDYGSLRSDLDALGKKIGKPFTHKLQELDERLAELEPPEDRRSGGSSWRNTDIPVSDSRADTDDAIREVFGALLE